jgi:hypothetical protein
MKADLALKNFAFCKKICLIDYDIDNDNYPPIPHLEALRIDML